MDLIETKVQAEQPTALINLAGEVLPRVYLHLVDVGVELDRDPRVERGDDVGVGVGLAFHDDARLAPVGVDVDEHRPVWHGVATKSITDSDRKNIDETVDAAVSAILEGFPPQ